MLMDNTALCNFAVQVIERIFRLERLLNLALDRELKIDREVILTFVQHLTVIKEHLFEPLKYIGGFKEEISYRNYRNTLKVISHCIIAIDRLHIHLSYIPGTMPTPETNAFVKALFQPFQEYIPPNQNISVILSNTYMFEEVDLNKYLSNSTNYFYVKQNEIKPTLFLPKMEFENPLQWATLVHEMCHAIPNNKNKLLNDIDYKKICNENEINIEILKRWAEEIFCDLLSLHLLGPAYLASFIDFVTVKGHELLEDISTTHPPTRYRIVLMNRILRKKKITAEFMNPVSGKSNLAEYFYWFFEERCEMQREYFMGFSTSTISKDMNIDFREFYNCIEEVVEEFIPFAKSIQPFNQDKFKHLVSRLEKNIPIGAYSSSKLTSSSDCLKCLKDIDEALISNPDQDNIKKNLYKAFDIVKETYCTIAEIINAGWIYKSEKIYLKAFKVLNKFNIEEQNRFKEKIYRLDSLLRNSIETSYLSQLFSRETNE